MSWKTFRTLVDACECIHGRNVAQKLKNRCYFGGSLPLATVFGLNCVFQGELKVRAKHLVKEQVVVQRVERHKQESKRQNAKINSESIYIRGEKWAVIVACRAPICFNLVSCTALLRCFLRRDVQTQRTRRDMSHMKVSNGRLFNAFFFFIICYWSHTEFSAVKGTDWQKDSSPLCYYIIPFIYKACEGASVLSRVCGGHRRQNKIGGATLPA